MMTLGHAHADQTLRTPQFYFLWIVLCFNVTAGIGVIGVAKTMMNEIFGTTLPAVVNGSFAATLCVDDFCVQYGGPHYLGQCIGCHPQEHLPLFFRPRDLALLLHPLDSQSGECQPHGNVVDTFMQPP